MVRKKDLTPLKKRGQIDVQKNKGATPFVAPTRGPVASVGPTAGINDYAKATPMAQPLPPGGPPEVL